MQTNIKHKALQNSIEEPVDFVVSANIPPNVHGWPLLVTGSMADEDTPALRTQKHSTRTLEMKKTRFQNREITFFADIKTINLDRY